jgi:hypothetical protein
MEEGVHATPRKPRCFVVTIRATHTVLQLTRLLFTICLHVVDVSRKSFLMNILCRA